jgi:hypothetical protein
MNNNYKVLAVFDYSSEAHILKSRLDSDGYTSLLMDEKTIDTDPLISNAIGGVKVLVHKKDFKNALEVYNEIRPYQKGVSCPTCSSKRILIGPLTTKNIFYLLFPFFEKTRHLCNDCNTLF